LQIKLIRMRKFVSTYRIIAAMAFMLLCFNNLKAQNCNIQLEDGVTMPVCYSDELLLSVEFNVNYSYVWTHNHDTIGNGPNVLVKIIENNSVYDVKILNTESGAELCSNSITITMRPKFDIDFEQLALTCSDKNADNGKTAKAKATASGGGYTTFTYHWNPPILPLQYLGDPQTAMGLSAYTNYTMTVTNEYGCSQTDTVRLKAYMNPSIEILSSPKDTVYLENPYVKWWFNNRDTVYDGHDTVIEISNFYWEFEGYEQTFTDPSPTITYYESENDHAITKLHVTNGYGCDTTYTDTHLLILPVQLKIPNIFTPNGDGVNDYFEIGYGSEGKPINDLSVYFLSSKLTIFNRWGRIVYESSDYKNDWDGGKLSDGTYFYVLECKGKTQDYRYKGSVMIWNSGR